MLVPVNISGMLLLASSTYTKMYDHTMSNIVLPISAVFPSILAALDVWLDIVTLICFCGMFRISSMVILNQKTFWSVLMATSRFVILVLAASLR